MPYRTPFDEMNENYKNRTGSFKPGPSAAPSKMDIMIQDAAAKFLDRMKGMVNPVNNVREADRRTGQVAAQNQALMGARPESGPTTSYNPTMIKEGISTAAQKAIAPVQGLMQRNRDDMARIQEQNAFNRVMGMRTSAEDPNFRGVNAQRAIDEGRTSGRSTPLINVNQPTGELKGPLSSVPQKAIKPLENLQQAGRDMREFAGGVGQDLEKLKGMFTPKDLPAAGFNAYPAGSTGLPGTYSGRYGTGAQGPATPPDYLKNVPAAAERSMQAQDKPAGYGPLYTKDNQPGTASASPPPGTITSPGAVDDKVKAGMPSDPPMRTTRTPTDQGEQVGTQKAGTTFNGSTAPSTGNRYAEMIAAGPEAQAKFIKDANLIHMIRGTDQTWGNPKIQGDLGVKEFKSALEAAAGVDAPTALTQDEAAKDRATELEKQKIANQKGRFQPVTETDPVTGQQSTKMVDTLLKEEIGSGQELDEVQSAADAWHASDKGEQAQADLKAAIKRHAKMRQYLQFLVSPNAK